MSTLKIGKIILKPMNMLWPLYVCWAYASWSDACTHQFIHFSSVNFGYPQHMQTELMHMLSMRLRNWCMRWAYASETDMCIEHMHQEQICALSTRIRNSCMHWAYYASGTRERTEHTRHQELVRALSILGTDACTEYMHQELMHALGTLRIRNLCVHWAYALGTYACSEHIHQFLMRMLSISVTIQNLKRSLLDMLSIRVRNSCVHWAYASGTYAYDQCAHKNLTDAEFPK